MQNNSIKSLRGMNDIGWPEIYLWHHIEGLARSICEAAGFYELRTPILENTALFKRGMGETTDVVEKEMYTFLDRNEESITLRPEGTASTVRAMLEHQWLNQHPVQKVYYMGPMFRYERPQKGRYRQFFQFGLELFGAKSPWADVEIMALQAELFKKLKIDHKIVLKINSLGCQVCRPAYRTKLLEILRPRAEELCKDCQRRLEKNPLRILDCKVEGCQKIASTLPRMIDQLCQECDTHLADVKMGLKKLGHHFEVDPNIVRGLDYYNRTAFEFVSSHIGAQGTVCGGGRYDSLVEQLGGSPTPAIGCAMGIERITLLLAERMEEFLPKSHVFFVALDFESKAWCYQLVSELRQMGIRADIELDEKSMKAQMKKADKSGASYAIIVGENEYKNQMATLKNMRDASQIQVAFKELKQELVKRIKL